MIIILQDYSKAGVAQRGDSSWAAKRCLGRSGAAEKRVLRWASYLVGHLFSSAPSTEKVVHMITGFPSTIVSSVLLLLRHWETDESLRRWGTLQGKGQTKRKERGRKEALLRHGTAQLSHKLPFHSQFMSKVCKGLLTAKEPNCVIKYNINIGSKADTTWRHRSLPNIYEVSRRVWLPMVKEGCLNLSLPIRCI